MTADCNLVERRSIRPREFNQGTEIMQKKVWQAPQVQTTPVSMEVTTYLPAQA